MSPIMFTGLVKDIGSVRQINGEKLFIESKLPNLKIGDSIACNGCCLTVTELDGSKFCVQASPETISKTAIGEWKTGTEINLEPSLKVGDEIGGHFVSGHVDGLAQLVSIQTDDEFRKLTLRAPQNLMKLIAQKGSVALDGISLTINNVGDDNFDVMIIPYTFKNTNLKNAKEGQFLHIEVDLLARYAARILEAGK